MKEKQNTCPVCFTKMRESNHVLVCPECGYKLCDHSYYYHDSYSTEHTHTPNYTTASQTASARPASPASQNARVTQPRQDTGKTISKTVRIVRTIILIYFLIVFLSGFIPGILAFFASMFF